jgi:poly-gamma-glutamate capsule biosynthesis protein CapA/YwtB (metallophosphatase superfamily)
MLCLILLASAAWCPSLQSLLAEEQTTRTSDEPDYSILFLGDTYFGESYQRQRKAAGKENVLETRGHSDLIADFAGLLARADLTIANLEAPITSINQSPYEGLKKYIHRADPVATTFQLKSHGIDAVSLANNHSVDYGAAGLFDSLKVLEQAGISHCGAGSNLEVAERILFLKAPREGSRRIAVLCAYWRNDIYEKFGGVYATPTQPGPLGLVVDTMAERIRVLRADEPQILIVVYPHWGWNYRQAIRFQQTAGRMFIDAGADLVIGHGAHLFQEIERYRNRWILYGIGNFVFGSEGRYVKFAVPPYSVIANLMLGDEGDVGALRLYPIVTDNLLTDFRPRFVTPAEFQGWQQLLEDFAVGWSASDLAQIGDDSYGAFVSVPFP